MISTNGREITGNFFQTLKTEESYFHRFNTRQDTRTGIFEQIETFFNQQKLHSSPGDRSPLRYEAQLPIH
jgi:putative transposase